jgi:predicted short-subunit dehydrogenase-like oxidoreductase (DUF2520 family)
MSSHRIRKVVILGAGKLATNFSMAIRKNGYQVTEVYNRSAVHGKTLARKLSARYIPEPELLSRDADLYILAVSDTAIQGVSDRLKNIGGLIVHTSGNAGMNVLSGCSSRYGVIYPPQTFITSRLVNFRSVPLCIEANSVQTGELLDAFAQSISDRVYWIDSEQRKILHLSAVFANNFTNFMYVISQDLLRDKGIDFRILEPIIQLTARRGSRGDAEAMQTGPAVRGDQETLREHLELLTGHPGYKEIYTLITQSIIQRKKAHDKL